jgi:DNA-binding protein H-NS
MTNAREIELSSYSLAELRTLSAEVARQITVKETHAMTDARRRIEQIARQVGLTLEQLLSKPRERGGAISVYVNPDDETQTWAGKGRMPAWIKVWLECGITLDELRRYEGVAK